MRGFKIVEWVDHLNTYLKAIRVRVAVPLGDAAAVGGGAAVVAAVASVAVANRPLKTKRKWPMQYVCKNYFVFLTPSVVGGLYELVEEIQLFREIWGVPVGQAGGGQGGRKGKDGEGEKGAHRGGFGISVENGM